MSPPASEVGARTLSPARQYWTTAGQRRARLPEALLERERERCVRIPMISEARSLNLSNSVAVGVFEALRQWGFPKLQNFGKMAD